MDFLTFKTFISPSILIIFYYIGAVIIPIVLFYKKQSLLKEFKFLNTIYEKIKSKFPKKVKLYLIIFFIFLEVLYRMIFEFLIAYMQIRDALV